VAHPLDTQLSDHRSSKTLGLQSPVFVQTSCHLDGPRRAIAVYSIRSLQRGGRVLVGYGKRIRVRSLMNRLLEVWLLGRGIPIS
jgi:hypothetical protein